MVKFLHTADWHLGIKYAKFNVTLYSCPVTQKQTRSDLTEWIKAMNKSISIGIAHGNLQIEGFIEDSNFPIDPERVEKSGLDYLAFEEWHSLFKYGGKDDVIRTVYPGTPEATKFAESDSGKAVIVEIEKHDSKPVIQEIDIGTLRWEEWTKEVSTKAVIPEGAIFGRTVETIVALMKYHPTLQEYSEISPKEAKEILRI